MQRSKGLLVVWVAGLIRQVFSEVVTNGEMVRVWEDEVYADPDNVDVTALFDDIHCEDDRQQYEAVVGLYWLADLRPTRVEPFENDVVGLLGELPDFGLGIAQDSAGFTTRSWGTEAVGQFTRSYPHVVSDLFDRAGNSDRRTRADARNALGHAAGLLEPASGVSSNENDIRSAFANRVHDHYSTITDWLHDGCQSTTSTALILLAGIAPWYCEEASDAIPVAVSHLNDSTTQSSAIGLLRSVALCNERRRVEIVAQLVEVLCERDSERPELLAITLDALVEIVEQYPESWPQMENCHREMTDHEHLAVRTRAKRLRSLLEHRE